MKYIPLTIHTIDSGDIKQVSDVLKSSRLTQGPKIKEFEQALCKYTEAKYAVAVSNGTAALHAACLAAGIGKGDEVIVPSISFVASANCVLYCGAKPVFCDIKADSANIDPRDIEKKITNRTKAIIPVHFSGNPVDSQQIYNIAKKNKLLVIEDAAHALGAVYRGAKIGSCRYSDMATLSLHPTKSITTGEGGVILTNDRKLYQRLLLFRSHGITKDAQLLKNNPGPWYYEMQTLGFNYRMTDFQASLGISQLKKIDRFILKRKNIAKIYDKAFEDTSWIKPLKIENNRKSSYHLYVVRIDFRKIKKTRKQVMEYLLRNGIETQVHYIPIYEQPYYKNELRYRVNCSKAKQYYQQALSLPIFVKMTQKEIVCVVRSLLKLGE